MKDDVVKLQLIKYWLCGKVTIIMKCWWCSKFIFDEKMMIVVKL